MNMMLCLHQWLENKLEMPNLQYLFNLVKALFTRADYRLHTTGWLQRLKQEGVEIHTRSAFLQGLLLMPRAAIPPKFAPWFDLWGKWHGWLARHNISAVEACLAFPLAFPGIDRVVVGADSVSQLEQIISASTRAALVDLPDLRCDAEDLINPTHWESL